MTDNEPTFNTDGWSGTCSKLWWGVGDYQIPDELPIPGVVDRAMDQCGLSKEDIYRKWDEYRQEGGIYGKGDYSLRRMGVTQDKQTGELKEIEKKKEGFLLPAAIAIGVVTLVGIIWKRW